SVSTQIPSGSTILNGCAWRTSVMARSIKVAAATELGFSEPVGDDNMFGLADGEVILGDVTSSFATLSVIF
ncbi:hypothetical protein, partial [Aeromonas veronii]|uniref:hypothetical protein n=1 Tax=Aeromonas veronii TaxID=654 RepID=UPI00406CCB1B